MTKINKYIIYYLQEIVTEKHLYYNYFRYNENEKLTIQNINKEINRQKNLYNKLSHNKNYGHLCMVILNKSYTINIVKNETDENEYIEEYNKLIKLPQYEFRNKPSLNILSDDLTDIEKSNEINRRLKNYEKFNYNVKEKRNRLETYLKNKYSKNGNEILVYNKTIKDMKLFLNEFLKTNNINGLNTNEYNSKKKVKCANCSKTFSLGNISHHYRIYHNEIYFNNTTKNKYDYISLN